MEVQRRQHCEAGAGGEERVGLQPAGDGEEPGEGGEEPGEAQRVDHGRARPEGVGGGPGHPVEGGRVLRLVAPGEGLGEQQRLDVVAAAGAREERGLQRHEHEIGGEEAEDPGGPGCRWLADRVRHGLLSRRWRMRSILAVADAAVHPGRVRGCVRRRARTRRGRGWRRGRWRLRSRRSCPSRGRRGRGRRRAGRGARSGGRGPRRRAGSP